MEKIIMEKKAKNQTQEETTMPVKVNPLRKERIYVRFVPHNHLGVKEKSHALYGGLADGSTVSLCVPVLRSTGRYKNVLTNDEKEFLEEALGLDYNGLSIYKEDNNFWDNLSIDLTKEGIYLDLSDPGDYIKYKVLLANNDIVAPSVNERTSRPKATYLFELVRSDEETNMENAKMDATMASYKEFGKIDNDKDTMRVLVSLLDGRPYSDKETMNFLRSRINVLIQSDPQKFLRNITDPLLHAKVLISRGVELGKVIRRGDYFYLASDGTPLCDNGQNPTLTNAAAFLNLPAHQDIKFILESEVDKNRV